MSANAASTLPEKLAEQLDDFFNLFKPSIELAERLIAARSNSQEILLLLCARLDALASSITSENTTNRDAFISLLVNYAGYRDLMRKVSIGDLYYDLRHHLWLAEGLIPKPGRLRKFSNYNDSVIELLDRSGIPITVNSVERFLARALRALKAKFRCVPGQPHTKLELAKPAAVMDALESEFRQAKDPELRQNLRSAFQPLIDKKTVAAILYEGFRNQAVHGVRVELGEGKFFAANEPFWQPLYSEYRSPSLFITFPAAFLVKIVCNCIETLRKQFAATQRLPPDVYFRIFGMDHLRFLDVDSCQRAVT